MFSAGLLSAGQASASSGSGKSKKNANFETDMLLLRKKTARPEPLGAKIPAKICATKLERKPAEGIFYTWEAPAAAPVASGDHEDVVVDHSTPQEEFLRTPQDLRTRLLAELEALPESRISDLAPEFLAHLSPLTLPNGEQELPSENPAEDKGGIFSRPAPDRSAGRRRFESAPAGPGASDGATPSVEGANPPPSGGPQAALAGLFQALQNQVQAQGAAMQNQQDGAAGPPPNLMQALFPNGVEEGHQRGCFEKSILATWSFVGRT